MEKKHKLKLIDGKFVPAEAGKVLLALLNQKISYHQMERFSNEERFGKDVLNSKSRIDELKEMRNSLEKIIHYASEKGMSIKIKSFIDIILIEKK